MLSRFRESPSLSHYRTPSGQSVMNCLSWMDLDFFTTLTFPASFDSSYQLLSRLPNTRTSSSVCSCTFIGTEAEKKPAAAKVIDEVLPFWAGHAFQSRQANRGAAKNSSDSTIDVGLLEEEQVDARATQRTRTGPSCWPKGGRAPRFSLGSRRNVPLLSTRRRSRRSWSHRIAEGGSGGESAAWQLDRSVVLSGSLSAGSFPTPCQSGNSLPGRCGAHTEGNVFTDGDDERPLKRLAHTPKRMRASVAKVRPQLELAARSTGPRCPLQCGSTCCQLCSRNLGHDPAELRRARMKSDEEAAKEIKAAFNHRRRSHRHWDGKIARRAMAGEGVVDRTQVCVGVRLWARSLTTPSRLVRPCSPALEDLGAGKERVRGLRFYTTAVNRGLVNGLYHPSRSWIGPSSTWPAGPRVRAGLEKDSPPALESRAARHSSCSRGSRRVGVHRQDTPEPFTPMTFRRRESAGQLSAASSTTPAPGRTTGNFWSSLRNCFGGVPKRGIRFSRPGPPHGPRAGSGDAAEAQGHQAAVALFVVRTYAAAWFLDSTRRCCAGAGPGLVNALYAHTPDKELSKGDQSGLPAATLGT
ncbi:hypothetical protein GWK47_015562 [Chionoecetes opilio]|uniref:Uncharacterized protein n=1 Tax=Chionoecetes opilio TaxID=41210 RepID=A0A8J4Y2Y1_CHIOP|nr:hypothetical protein GWK47_015562 [Chionoecetes opilio]